MILTCCSFGRSLSFMFGMDGVGRGTRCASHCPSTSIGTRSWMPLPSIRSVASNVCDNNLSTTAKDHQQNEVMFKLRSSTLQTRSWSLWGKQVQARQRNLCNTYTRRATQRSNSVSCLLIALSSVLLSIDCFAKCAPGSGA